MSTLPPTPSFNANIPVVTSSGGSSAAYKDPNSPESIMKKTTLVQAQTAVDTSYDVNQDSPAVKEAFKSRGMRRKNNKYVSFIFIIAILFIIFGRKIKAYAKIFFGLLAALLFTIILQNGSSGP